MGNTNIPPKPSNFLQRVGRAGRKEGSALVLNYAHAGEPHDMYYYTYPEEMMQGEVNTPGCFLEAKDILRRHFLAYCIDTWTSSDVQNTLPSNIRDLHLLNDNIFNDEAFILNRIVAFIKITRFHYGLHSAISMRIKPSQHLASCLRHLMTVRSTTGLSMSLLCSPIVCIILAKNLKNMTIKRREYSQMTLLLNRLKNLSKQQKAVWPDNE